jgi:hypothetical protein
VKNLGLGADGEYVRASVGERQNLVHMRIVCFIPGFKCPGNTVVDAFIVCRAGEMASTPSTGATGFPESENQCRR